MGSFSGKHKWIIEGSWMTRRFFVAPSVLKRSVEGSLGCFASTLAVAGTRYRLE